MTPAHQIPPLGGPSHESDENAVDSINAALDKLNGPVEYLELLGGGVFGQVWSANYEGQLVAAKVTGCPTGFREDELNTLKQAQGIV